MGLNFLMLREQLCQTPARLGYSCSSRETLTTSRLKPGPFAVSDIELKTRVGVHPRAHALPPLPFVHLIEYLTAVKTLLPAAYIDWPQRLRL